MTSHLHSTDRSQSAPAATVAFDLGGVLMTDATLSGFTVLESLLHVKRESAERLWQDEMRIPAELGEIGEEDIWQRIAALAPRSTTPADVRRVFLSEFRPIPHGVAELKRVRTVGLKTALATNHLTPWLDIWKRSFEWFSLFDAVFCSDTMHARKPEPAFFDTLARHLLSPVVFVDDDLDNICAAEQAGFRTVLATGRAWTVPL